MDRHKIALIGCGTVGSGVAALLTKDADLLAQRTGRHLHLAYVVDRDFSRARALGLDERLFCDDYRKALADPEVEIVVELVGGTGVAKTITEEALKAGKHVVTANKALLAHHGPDLLRLAREHGVAVAFEASCGGGIPIIRALYDGLIANRIDALYGIVNGTCNYILTRMIGEGIPYEAALKEAQEQGFAEADPTLDVSGMDSAHKLTIMASLAFGCRVDLNAVPVQGIHRLELLDITYGRELGYVMKLLAVARREEGGLSLVVRPSFISTEHPLAWVSGSFNAVSVYGHATGHTMYYGRGAGSRPTASAIVADIVALVTGTYPRLFQALPLWPDRGTPPTYLPLEATISRFYLRIMVEDRPGVLARITGILGEHDISISSVLQKEVPEGRSTNHVPIVIITHTVGEARVQEAADRIGNLPTVHERPVIIPIVDEHEESIG
ncbi:homoserine dehydrogenase [Spirochaeta thermophila]|uniref:Homoserine dehydrogenase n=1 Tax=Winmispira thermophila (strain ATCC 49972 / DSM 6192 / RI 19.B1) TaxID=665571 RepID=E0RNG8_WINT6|nr:homoserine dehydrogenase [Spirochaeta thermophila]ADN01168.1 homoserine dehydrogenase [Spirochaeta thermophila DSM 6192]